MTVILSGEPVADSACITEDTFNLREEISKFLEKSSFEISELDLVKVSPFELKSKLFLFMMYL